MPENEKQPIPVSSIHYDIKTRRLMGLLEDGSALQFTLTPDLKLTYNGHFKPQVTDDVVQPAQEAAQRESLVDDAVGSTTRDLPVNYPQEKQEVSTYTGKIKGDVREGHADSQKRPTAWARVAVHEDEEETAKMLSTTFHRHTARIALSLKPEALITMQGYLRPATQAGRMDQFSAFNIVDYPNKPQKDS